jgi:hypothetical protein
MRRTVSKRFFSLLLASIVHFHHWQVDSSAESEHPAAEINNFPYSLVFI